MVHIHISVLTASFQVPPTFQHLRYESWAKVTSLSCNGAIFTLLASSLWYTATPLHWIYDQGKIRELVDKVGGKPEFYPTSQSPVYNIETGRNGAYGDQLYVTLKSVAENKGTYAKPHSLDHYLPPFSQMLAYHIAGNFRWSKFSQKSRFPSRRNFRGFIA